MKNWFTPRNVCKFSTAAITMTAKGCRSTNCSPGVNGIRLFFRLCVYVQRILSQVGPRTHLCNFRPTIARRSGKKCKATGLLGGLKQGPNTVSDLRLVCQFILVLGPQDNSASLQPLSSPHLQTIAKSTRDFLEVLSLLHSYLLMTTRFYEVMAHLDVVQGTDGRHASNQRNPTHKACFIYHLFSFKRCTRIQYSLQ